MTFVNYLKKIVKRGRLTKFRLINSSKKRFACPVCKYNGPFMDINPATGLRKNAKCPNCGSLERHRNQYLVLQIVLTELNTEEMAMLHFAPEATLRNYLSKHFHIYETADLNMSDVDYRVDLQNLPFRNSSYDFVFASHVLEHIVEDRLALREIHRVLKPGGLAILLVPITRAATVEWHRADPARNDHVRECGRDYFDRYRDAGFDVTHYQTDDFPDPEEYSLVSWQDGQRVVHWASFCTKPT